MPAAWAKSQKLWHERVHPEWEWSQYSDVVFAAGPERFVQVKLFLPREGKKGVERAFGETGVIEKSFECEVSDLDVPPLELIPRPRSPDEMTLREVRSYARRVGRFGGSPRDYLVAAQAKLAYPFANVVVCALGIPIALRLRKSSRVLSFVGALAIYFAYLWLMEVGRALGVGGSLPPWAAAWSADAAFGVFAATLIWRLDL